MSQRIVVLFLFFFVGAFIHAQEVHHHGHSLHHAFLENKGQWPDHVLFKSRVHGGNLWVEQGRFMIHLQDLSEQYDAHAQKGGAKSPEEIKLKQRIVSIDFLEAQHISSIDKKGATEHSYNFFLGNHGDKWATGVKGYNEFTLYNIYPNINLKLLEKQEDLKYEFILAPKANPELIRMKIKGHEKLKVNRNGELEIQTELGNIIDEKPYAYQIINGKIIEVDCSFDVNKDEVSYALGDYNRNYELVIDPTLVFATYNGAVSDNFGMTATFGNDGSAYVAGTVFGNDYPTPDPNAYDPNGNLTVQNVGVVTTDAFISKYSDDGTTMLWSTFFGGGDNTQGTDVPHSLICDEDDNIYVYGVTSSLDFPIQGGFQTSHAGGTALSFNSIGANFGNVGTDIYVAKFSANGQNLLGSTYVGGSDNDGVNYLVSSGNYSGPNAYDSLTMNYGDQLRGEIMLNESNDIIIASASRSIDFPTETPFQPTLAGQQDGVVFQIRDDFSELMWSSYYGGSENDGCYSVKIDEDDNIIFSGGTSSNDLTMIGGGYQDNFQGGKADGFVVKLDPSGTNITGSTYLGTGDYDQIYFVEVDRNGVIFTLGQTLDGNFPVIGSVYENPGSTQFVTVFTDDLSAIIRSTVFGSSEPIIDISPSAFMVDICGNVYISGWGRNILQNINQLQNMPVTSNAFQSSAPNGFDFYLIVLERELADILYGSYMGGGDSNEHVDGGTSRFDRNGVVYQGVCGGCGGNSDFPTTPGAWSAANNASNCNALVFKYDFNLIPNAEFTIDNNLGCAPFEVTFDNFSSDSDAYTWDFGNGDLDSTTFEPTITYTDPGVYEVNLYVTDSICLITDTATLFITVTPELELENIDSIVECNPVDVNLVANSFGSATEFVWSTNANFTDTLNTSLSDSTATDFATNSGFYYIQISNPGCSLVDSVEVFFTSAALELDGDVEICLEDTAFITASSTDPEITFSNFQWSPTDAIISGQGTSEVMASPSSTQFIYLTAEASNGCIVTDSILVAVSFIDPNDVFAIASDSLVPVGTSVTLEAQPNGYSYQWFPPGSVANPNDQITDANVFSNSIFTVFVSDSICVRSASVQVKVFEFVCEEPYVFIPNAFTPNDDGNNDIIYAQSSIIDETEDFILRIYNRWGELVFETNDITQGWDGTWRGKKLAPDVYDYYMEGFCVDGQSFLIQGNITLVR
jgi:gliding motility-associated-like protein